MPKRSVQRCIGRTMRKNIAGKGQSRRTKEEAASRKYEKIQLQNNGKY